MSDHFGRFPDVWHALEAIHAYDEGATDSGVHDEELRTRCTEAIDAMTEPEFRVGIGRFCRDAYLTDENLNVDKQYAYGMEDAARFFNWVFDGDFRPFGR